jgi:hypothetical protein
MQTDIFIAAIPGPEDLDLLVYFPKKTLMNNRTNAGDLNLAESRANLANETGSTEKRSPVRLIEFLAPLQK